MVIRRLLPLTVMICLCVLAASAQVKAAILSCNPVRESQNGCVCYDATHASEHLFEEIREFATVAGAAPVGFLRPLLLPAF
jgi:hypothetical protein